MLAPDGKNNCNVQFFAAILLKSSQTLFCRYRPFFLVHAVYFPVGNFFNEDSKWCQTSCAPQVVYNKLVV